MKIFQVDSKDKDDVKLLYELQNASKLVLCKNLRLCYNFDACLESMEREGYIKQLNDVNIIEGYHMVISAYI